MKQKEETEFSAFLQEMTATAAVASHPSSAFKTSSLPAKTPQGDTSKKSELLKKKAASKGSAASKERVEEDRFSAAVDALAKLDISQIKVKDKEKKPIKHESVLLQIDTTKGKSSSKARPNDEEGGGERGAKQQIVTILSREADKAEAKPAKEKVADEEMKKSRELSPSVAAIFEAAGNETLSKSPVSDSFATPQGVNKPDQKTTVMDNSSAALKNILHIGTPSANPAPTNTPRPSNPLGTPQPQHISPSVLKLMRPSMLTLPGYTPRPGLLPNPYGPQMHPMRGGCEYKTNAYCNGPLPIKI